MQDERMRSKKPNWQAKVKIAKEVQRKKNKEQRKLRKTERRRDFRGELTPEMKSAVYQHYGKTCYLCGKPPNADTIDHVIPITKGGSHRMTNLRPAHEDCNKDKGNKIVVLPEELEGVGW